MDYPRILDVLPINQAALAGAAMVGVRVLFLESFLWAFFGWMTAHAAILGNWRSERLVSREAMLCITEELKREIFSPFPPDACLSCVTSPPPATDGFVMAMTFAKSLMAMPTCMHRFIGHGQCNAIFCFAFILCLFSVTGGSFVPLCCSVRMSACMSCNCFCDFYLLKGWLSCCWTFSGISFKCVRKPASCAPCHFAIV